VLEALGISRGNPEWASGFVTAMEARATELGVGLLSVACNILHNWGFLVQLERLAGVLDRSWHTRTYHIPTTSLIHHIPRASVVEPC
jgi:hypothetical protein